LAVLTRPNTDKPNHYDSNPAKDDNMADMLKKPWQEQVYDLLKAANIKFFTYVPDGGHKQLIIRCNEDPDVTAVPLTIETEGVAFAAGAFALQRDWTYVAISTIVLALLIYGLS